MNDTFENNAFRYMSLCLQILCKPNFIFLEKFLKTKEKKLALASLYCLGQKNIYRQFMKTDLHRPTSK